MGSERLPGKVLMDIEGRPLLERVLRRVEAAKKVTGILVTTPATSDNDPIHELVDSFQPERIPVASLAPSAKEWDVYSRYVETIMRGLGRIRELPWLASLSKAFIRITADCPALDPILINRAVQYHLDGDYLYTTTVGMSGFDVEVVDTKFFLSFRDDTTMTDYAREHVTPRVKDRVPDARKKVVWVPNKPEWMKFSVDTQADLDFVRRLYAALGDNFEHVDAIEWGRNTTVAMPLPAEMKVRI
jgi:spore coat polysaccharide biosynthesis protein SpsF